MKRKRVEFIVEKWVVDCVEGSRKVYEYGAMAAS